MPIPPYPRTQSELEETFPTEDACRQYLLHLRWPQGFRCPRCGGATNWWTTRGLLMCRACSYQTSVLAGTIFQDTHTPLQTWFRAIWWVCSQKTGASALGLQRALGLGSYRTGWTWLHKLRRAMIRPGRDRLSGIVEVDETYVGGKKPGKRGRGATGKALVLIAAHLTESRIGRIRLCQLKDASATSLEQAIIASVEPGSTVRTDGWRGYRQVTQRGYRHDIVRPGAEVGENLLPHCHRIAALLKRWLLGTHQGAVTHAHLAYYLDEYTFRFNRRTSRHRGLLFYRLLQQAVAIDPVPLKSMVKRINQKQPHHKI